MSRDTGSLEVRVAAAERERDRLAEVLHVLGELSTRDLPPGVLMEEIVQHVQRLTGATGAVVELADGDALRYAVASGTIGPCVGLRLARATSLSGRCVALREVMYSPDTGEDPRVDRAACEVIDARAMMVVPLLHGRDAVGVLKVTAGRVDAFDAIDEHALRLSAGIIAGLLARAGLPAG